MTTNDNVTKVFPFFFRIFLRFETWFEWGLMGWAHLENGSRLLWGNCLLVRWAQSDPELLPPTCWGRRYKEWKNPKLLHSHHPIIPNCGLHHFQLYVSFYFILCITVIQIAKQVSFESLTKPLIFFAKLSSNCGKTETETNSLSTNFHLSQNAKPSSSLF